MKLRLHEIELGIDNVEKATAFYQATLGLTPKVQQESLTVFDAGLRGLDFNLSHHLSTGNVAISFLTDDLAALQKHLNEAGISYQGPFLSHLGMTCIQFSGPGGLLIKVNSPGPDSPEWLHYTS
jgi:catechol 2,3-dioxygenase-like lactoylglutathione lyase family enzyme